MHLSIHNFKYELLPLHWLLLRESWSLSFPSTHTVLFMQTQCSRVMGSVLAKGVLELAPFALSLNTAVPARMVLLANIRFKKVTKQVLMVVCWSTPLAPMTLLTK